jgi:hypothetical protein
MELLKPVSESLDLVLSGKLDIALSRHVLMK